MSCILFKNLPVHFAKHLRKDTNNFSLARIINKKITHAIDRPVFGGVQLLVPAWDGTAVPPSVSNIMVASFLFQNFLFSNKMLYFAVLKNVVRW